MNNLVKKYYWLILTTIFSLFIFLITTWFKQLSTGYLSVPISSTRYVEEMYDINRRIINRYQTLHYIDSAYIRKNKIDSLKTLKLFFYSLDSIDFRIQKDLVSARQICMIFEDLKPMERQLNLAMKLENTLKYEDVLWEMFADLYVNRNNSEQDAIKFYFDYRRRYNEYYACFGDLIKDLLTTRGIFWKLIKPAIKNLLIFLSIILVGFIITFLIPIGIEIWSVKSGNSEEE